MEHTAPILVIRTSNRFRNPEKSSRGFSDFLKWIFNRKKVDWPKWIDSKPGPAPVSRTDENEIRVTFVNHSTFLIQMDKIFSLILSGQPGLDPYLLLEQNVSEIQDLYLKSFQSLMQFL
jgi:hypothetical protein